MNQKSFIFSLPLAFCGAVLLVVGTSNLAKTNQLATGQNPFGLYQSAYGKLLARLAETTVDRVWHLGIEQIVPHYMTGDSHGVSKADITKDSLAAGDKKIARPSLIEASKGWVQKRVVSQFTRTNPYSLSTQHKERVHQDIAKMLARSYQMDPTHYGAYNSYHLFITSHTLGGTDRSREFARKLGENTILTILAEEEDPEPYLTAASAAMNLFLLETEDARVEGETISLETLKRYRTQISAFLEKFEMLQDKAEERGTWDYVSTDRQVEIMQRFRFSNKTFSQFDAMIARAESKDASEPEAEVAETAE